MRWRVGGHSHQESFRTKALADSFRAALVRATRAGEAFDVETGRPESAERKNSTRTWYEHARAYAEMKAPHVAAKTRRAMSEALTTVTVAMVTTTRGAPEPDVLRQALFKWAFNPGSRGKTPPPEVVSSLSWIAAASVPVVSMREPAMIRRALDACARTLDGRAAAATTSRRKRTVLYNALGYAVEEGLLESNPVDRVQ